jgi:hypothetical protein
MSNEETIARKGDAAIRALGELFLNPKVRAHVYYRYILVRRASGELIFEQSHSTSMSNRLSQSVRPAEAEKAGDQNRAFERMSR